MAKYNETTLKRSYSCQNKKCTITAALLIFISIFVITHRIYKVIKHFLLNVT